MSRKVARELSFKVIFSFYFQNENEQIESLINNLENETKDINSEDELEILSGLSEGVEITKETKSTYEDGMKVTIKKTSK